ncbi:receptor-type tyrosine-protein phosphatase T-like, partial [Saccostrea cucullata]|uniref:receptor-type tyrosine-protein phosphatase T-like n=1 Tax=Saccostrea cuccullata TaxID=36930 RepID=UPI002ED5C421
FTHCYENLSRRSTTTLSQSSTYHNASRANDGDRSTTENYCAHTASINTNRAWFQVDLGKPYSIKSVNIYYRKEGQWQQYRFRQFYLDVSDYPATSTTTSQRTRCYTDNSTHPDLPPNIIQIPCKQTARYVIVETKYIYPGDPGPILEICEIEVIGCATGRYGGSCSLCSCSSCDVVNGVCQKQCNQGCYQGQCESNGYCTKGCYFGYWGDTCSEQCPSTCAQNNCYTNGNCYSCKANYAGNKCETRLCPNCYQQVCAYDTGICSNGCVAGYYGSYCSKPCSDRCNPRICDSGTGDCTYNCTVGYYGPKCETPCSPTCSTLSCRKSDGACVNGCRGGYYGLQCKRQCSQQCKNNTCNFSSGHCERGCNDGHYGDVCSHNCNAQCVNHRCNQTNGFCSDGCVLHWIGKTCNSCVSTHYGPDCALPCSKRCKNGTCYSDGYCDKGCMPGYFGYYCDNNCSSCPFTCDRTTGDCSGECRVGYYGNDCSSRCNTNCKNACSKDTGACDNGCVDGKYGSDCQLDCSFGCDLTCERRTGNCTCKPEWQGYKCNECRPNFYGANCTEKCSSNCLNGHCHAINGTCLGGCRSGFLGDQCGVVLPQSSPSDIPVSAIGAGVGTVVFVIVAIIIVFLFIRFRRQKSDKKSTPHVSYSGDNLNIFSRADNKLYTNIGNVSVPIEDPEEEPQTENPEEAVYYNDLSVAKDIAVSNLMNVIKEKEAKENEGSLKEFKSLPYGERFACDTAKTEENMPKNRFKTTFPYDHSRVILEVGKGFTSDYINANYIENMGGKREFIACQGPRENTLVDHWRMIWQEHVEYIVMLTNLIEGPKVKCHQYWPDEKKELDINPFSVTLVEEKVYAYFVERKMTVQKKRVTGSRTVVQYHYTRWPDHGTPNPLNLVVFHRHFRHKIRSTQHPIIVHCSAGIGRTGTFIALDVLSRYGKDKGKVNVIEYVKAMRKDRMTMIQNVDQYMFLYHALYEYFRRKAQYRKKDEFLSLYIDVNKTDTQKQLTNEFNELISLKPRYDAKDFKSGKKFSKLNLTKSALPVEQYLVYLTSHVPGRESYYNAVNVSSFTRADEFISAQLPVPGAAIDLVRLLLDHESEFLISLNPLSEVKELQSWVEEKIDPIKLSPFTITKDSQTTLSKGVRKTSMKITKKEDNEETHDLQIFECLNWSFSEILPKETSTLTNLIKQFSLDRKSHSNRHVTVISKDGATCCGVFIAVYNAMEQLQQDDEVDLFTIVQQLQCRRPEMITTKEEYEFCFKAVSDFLNTDSVYANT